MNDEYQMKKIKADDKRASREDRKVGCLQSQGD